MFSFAEQNTNEVFEENEGLNRVLGEYGGHIIGPNYFGLDLRAKPSELARLREFIRSLCGIYSVPEAVCGDVVLAADEAATNVIIHGYSREELEKGARIVIRLKFLKPGLIRFEMLDRGIWFSGLPVKKPDIMENIRGERIGGFGMYIIHCIMDRVNYRRMGGLNLFQAEKSVQLSN